MNVATIRDFREKALLISKGIRNPAFYDERFAEIEQSARIASQSPNVRKARSIMYEKRSVFGHGFDHAHKVAIESGAILFSEIGINERSDRLAENILIAGYLHDIKRNEKNHPEKGAEYARELMGSFLKAYDLEMIAFAIKNHEAFREHEVLDDGDYMLVSNSLYDADKFRWGPDNFIYTIWDIVESMHLDIDTVFNNYEKGIEGIVKIKMTFRTDTGRKYGPDFVDLGLEIGEKLYNDYRNSGD